MVYDKSISERNKLPHKTESQTAIQKLAYSYSQLTFTRAQVSHENHHNPCFGQITQLSKHFLLIPHP